VLPWKSSANASFRILTTAQSLVYPSRETPMRSAHKTCPMQRLSGIGIYWVTWLWRRCSCLIVSFAISTLCLAALIPAAILPFVSTTPPPSRPCSSRTLSSSALMPCWRFPTSVWIRLIPRWYALYPRAVMPLPTNPCCRGTLVGGARHGQQSEPGVRRRRRG
jgi:hypothetical protein